MREGKEGKRRRARREREKDRPGMTENSTGLGRIYSHPVLGRHQTHPVLGRPKLSSSREDGNITRRRTENSRPCSGRRQLGGARNHQRSGGNNSGSDGVEKGMGSNSGARPRDSAGRQGETSRGIG